MLRRSLGPPTPKVNCIDTLFVCVQSEHEGSVYLHMCQNPLVFVLFWSILTSCSRLLKCKQQTQIPHGGNPHGGLRRPHVEPGSCTVVKSCPSHEKNLWRVYWSGLNVCSLPQTGCSWSVVSSFLRDLSLRGVGSQYPSFLVLPLLLGIFLLVRLLFSSGYKFGSFPSLFSSCVPRLTS